MKESNVKIEKISVVLLHSGLDYQRKVTDEKRVKDIAVNWDAKKFQYPCVSYRDGMYNVIDGQHTIAAFKMRNGTTAEIPCKVARGLTMEEESKWFYEEAIKSKPQSLNAIYNARLYSKDSKLMELIDDLKQAGLLLKINIPSGTNVVSALVTIEKIHDEMNSIDFISCFSILQNTWNGDKNSLTEGFLKGMLLFYNTYKNNFDENRFIKTLSKVEINKIKSQVDNDIYTKETDVKYAQAFVQYYNKSIKKSELKLKPSKLMD